MQTIALIAKAYDETETVTLTAPPWPFGVIDRDGYPYSFDVIGSEIEVYASDMGFTTGGSDIPAHTSFPPRLTGPFNYQARMFEGNEPTGRTKPGFGDITINNADSGLDDKLKFGWDGREILLYRGERGAAFSTFSLIFRGTAEGLFWDEREIRVRLRDRQVVFDRPIQGRLYGGTGGADGSEDVAGKPIPQAYGKLFNIAPVLIDPTNLIYQFHDRLANAVNAVRDKGVALDFSADYADYAALVDATVDSAEYATCLAQGMIRLGSLPVGVVTADVEGDAQGEYVKTTGTICRRIATTRLGTESFSDPDGLDTDAFTQLETDQPATVGYYTGAEVVTAGDVMGRLMAGIGGSFWVRLDGKLSLAVLKVPTGTADHTLTARDPSGRQRLTRRGVIPSHTRRVGYKRNWTVQGPADLAGAVTASDRSLYGEQYRFATAADGSVQTKHRLARDVETQAYFADEDDAQDEADRLIDLHGTERDFYEMALTNGDPFDFTLGELIDVTGIDRFDLDDSKKFRLIGMSVDKATNALSLELWG